MTRAMTPTHAPLPARLEALVARLRDQAGGALVALAEQPEDAISRVLEAVFAWEPARAHDVLAPALAPSFVAARRGAGLARAILEWLAGDGAARLAASDPRVRRLRDEVAIRDRHEALEGDAQATARRHFREEPRWQLAVLRVAGDGALRSEALWRLIGLAALELPDDDAWSVLDPLLSPERLTHKGGGEQPLEALFADPFDVSPGRSRRLHARLASRRYLDRLADLAGHRGLEAPATRMLEQAIGRALERPAGELLDATEGLRSRMDASTALLLDRLDDSPTIDARLAADDRWLPALSELARHRSRGAAAVAGELLRRTLRRVLALPPDRAFAALEPCFDVRHLDDERLAAAAAAIPALIGERGVEAIEALLRAEPRMVDRLLAYTVTPSAAQEDVPIGALLEVLFEGPAPAVFDRLAPMLAPPVGRPGPGGPPRLIRALALDLDLACGEHDGGGSSPFRRHIVEEPRWAEVTLSWYIWDRAQVLALSNVLPFALSNSRMTAEALCERAQVLFPAAAMRDDDAERGAGLLLCLQGDPRLDAPCFLDLFVACLNANLKRAWILEAAVARLVAAGDLRAVSVLVAMLRGSNLPHTLPGLLGALRDPRIPAAIVRALPDMPLSLLEGMHAALRVQADPAVAPALEQLASGRGKGAVLARATARALRAIASA